MSYTTGPRIGSIRDTLGTAGARRQLLQRKIVDQSPRLAHARDDLHLVGITLQQREVAKEPMCQNQRNSACCAIDVNFVLDRSSKINCSHQLKAILQKSLRRKHRGAHQSPLSEKSPFLRNCSESPP